MTEQKPTLSDMVLRTQASPESIAQINRNVAQATIGLRRLSFNLRARGALSALLNGNDDAARDLLARFDGDQVRQVQNAGVALSLMTSRLLMAEGTEGDRAALDEAWLLTIKAEGLEEFAGALDRYADGSSWGHGMETAIGIARKETGRMRQRAEELRASAEQPGEPQPSGEAP